MSQMIKNNKIVTTFKFNNKKMKINVNNFIIILKKSMKF